MKPSGGQYRSDISDSGSMSRGGSQQVSAIPTTGPGGHAVYLAQHPSLMAAHRPTFGSQSSSSSPHGPRDYHPHHLQAELPHRSHVPGPGHSGMGINPGHVPMHMPQRRRTSGQRLSLLWDIGVAGERERDRAESSASSILSHSYTTTASGSSHVIPGPVVYGGRPNMSMMSSLGGLQASQRNLASGSVASQPPPGTPPRHSASSGQLARPGSSSLHSYSGGSSPFMLPGPSAIKSETGGFVKEESKSPMHSIPSHYPQMVHSQSFSGQPATQRTHSQNEPPDKEMENMPSKESLLQSMEKVDKDINKVALEIKGLERKKQQLETAAKKPPQTEKSTSPKKIETKHKDLWQVIYAENKRKAESARGMLDHLCQRYDMPLYNQPCDTKVYQENLKKNEEMRPKLLAYFQRRSQLSNIRERYLCARYDQLMLDWQRRTERIENNVKRKTKEVKVRDFFEKQFPEIRKQREQQERFSRSGTRSDTCRSEADFNEIVDGLTEQENQEQHMRQLAVVPPMLLDRDERRLKFINNNGLVTDPMEDYKKRQELDHWNAQEKQIFKEKYIQHPKNFHVIASFLEKKSVTDCVLFYYLSKKSIGYKALVRKNSLKPRKVKSGRGHTQQASTSSNSAQDASKNGLQVEKGPGDSVQKEESLESIIKVEEIERIDRPPSPRITRSRNKNLNWTDGDISMAKEGFGKHGKDFAAISRMFTNKTENQIKVFYQNSKKKHNLDQLISEAKKKKPDGGRRTRTHVQTSESSSTTPTLPDDETPAVEETRPKSADPQLFATSEPSETNTKKRKKEIDTEKTEEQMAVESTSVASSESEMSSAPPRVSSSSTSQIRTRRSAAPSSNTEPVKAVQSGKRNSESPPSDEPAEKKSRKSKSTKETKVENKEPTLSEEKNKVQQESKEKEPENTEVVQAKEQDVEETPKEPENAPTPISSTSTSTITSAIPIASSTKSIVTTSAPAAMEVKPTTVATTIQSDETPAPASTTAEPIAPKIVETKRPTPQPEPPVPQPVLPLQLPPPSGRENDSDSSATCSADEDPNMHDVESKVASRRHSDSPYAFEDDSSASIKLESSRAPMPPLSAAPTPQMKEPLPAKTPPTYYLGRPASTHPPQPSIVKQDEKRPQSLPPPLGAIAPSTMSIGALNFFHPPPMHKQVAAGNARPNSTPTIVVPSVAPSTNTQAPGFTGVGEVPGANAIRMALQRIQVPQMGSLAGLATVPYPKAKKPSAAESYHTDTIDLTVTPSSGESSISDSSKIIKEQPIQHLPHYHPVPREASSLQKDFSAHKVDMQSREDQPPPARHREYTPSDIASMRERAAPIPIPVSSLRAPMPGSLQRNEKPRQEQTMKKETPAAPVVSAPKHLVIQPGQQPVLAPNPASVGRLHLTTSSVATKFVSGSMTSGAPVRQNQPPSTKPPGPPVLAEARRPDIITQTQAIHHPSEVARYRRSPGLEAGPPLLIPRGYTDMSKAASAVPRSSIVKMAGGMPVPGLDPAAVVPDNRKEKSGPGSITTGLPVHRGHDDRIEHRTEVIAGKQVVVKQPPYPRASPHPDPARLQEVERHGLRFPMPMAGLANPALFAGLQQKALQGAGSILDGRPVVKRKTSDESNSSLSPSANPTVYPGVVVSRPSPTMGPTVPRHTERRMPNAGERAEELRNIHHHRLMAERAAQEELFSLAHHRRTPEKLTREPAARIPSPSQRQTPTNFLAQHPVIKQELPGSPHTAEEFLRAHAQQQQQQQALPMSLLDMHRLQAMAAAGNPDLTRLPLGLHQIPLTTPGVSQDLLEIWRQYGRASGVASGPPVFPMFLTPAGLPAQYPPGLVPSLNPAGAMVPVSLQGDDSRETTKKMLNQDFKTAQLMSQLRHPVQVSSVTASLGFPLTGAPALTTPGIGISPLVASAANPYHPLATSYAGSLAAGLPVDRVNFIPALGQNLFSPQFVQQPGRSSAEANRSPAYKPSRPVSPEPVRHRHRSGEAATEFMNQIIKDRNSPTSPYRPPRGNASPQRYPPQGPAYPRLSPSQLAQIPPQSYPHYPHSSTPPVPLSHHHRKSPHLPPGAPHPYPGPDVLSSRIHDSRSSPHLKHSRSGSLDGSIQPRFERARTDSASPHPRSLPQSPNDVHEQASKYAAHIRHTQSPKSRHEPKTEYQPAPVIMHEPKLQPVRAERPRMHTGSPRPVQKHPADRGDARLQQQAMVVGGSHHIPQGVPQRRETRSPYTPPHKETVEPTSQTDQGHLKGPPQMPPARQSMPNRMPQEISVTPGEDLKVKGRTKMKAATLIDNIINMHFDVTPQSKTPDIAELSNRPSKTVVSTPQMVPNHSKQPSDPSHKRLIEEPQTSKRDTAPSKPQGYEVVTKAPVASMPTSGYQPHRFSVSPFAQAAPPISAVPNLAQTFAKHSADVIDQCYRDGATSRKASPGRTASPVLHQPAVIVTEPISPEKRMVTTRSDARHLPPPTVHPQYHQHQRFLTPPSEAVIRTRHEAPLPGDVARPSAVPTRPQVPQQMVQPNLPPSSGGSLEDIIRKALLTGDRSPAQSPGPQQSRDKSPLGIMGFPDMMISQAMMATMAGRLPGAASAQPPVTTRPNPSSAPEERKGTPPTAQSQSGSEKYMSALMFRTAPSQNVPPPAAPPERQQQAFYQPPQRATHAATSQSPGPQEPNASQSRPAMLLMPQYEALSDSDD